MHIPGVYYNNRNWLHVIKAMRVWCVVSMLLTPLCTAAAVVFEQATGWQVWGAVLSSAYRIHCIAVWRNRHPGKEVSMTG